MISHTRMIGIYYIIEFFKEILTNLIPIYVIEIVDSLLYSGYLPRTKKSKSRILTAEKKLNFEFVFFPLSY